ncbi:hypothetical protein BDBG_03459 [Blastomyces gilchristii SLH14081]|uniref:Uncharacterized protein n=1 Tax=Blastomyces gilchristii (strain SLH14081) TaxID=559298 RepID=A0A179UK38_BLAGS|nr:uncharacterized protein BDBG_03459 [Blastomyces gilchristii SLH14081]OAT07391.1 hypothetical protein BDBG_03459 [Blastomyces gilchristii SLH14081]
MVRYYNHPIKSGTHFYRVNSPFVSLKIYSYSGTNCMYMSDVWGTACSTSSCVWHALCNEIKKGSCFADCRASGDKSANMGVLCQIFDYMWAEFAHDITSLRSETVMPPKCLANGSMVIVIRGARRAGNVSNRMFLRRFRTLAIRIYGICGMKPSD